MEHFNLDKIQSYIEGQIKGEELNEIEGHLATCDRCRSVYMELKTMEKPLESSFKEMEASASCPEDWEIGALLQGETPKEASKKLSSHIKDCSFCTERAAVYYKALEPSEQAMEVPDSWKQKAVKILSAEQTVKEEKIPLLQRILSFLPDLTSPIPAVAYAAVLLVVAVLVWTSMYDKVNVITIASTEKLVIRESEIPSSFGFTGAGESKEVKNMEIIYRGENIIFKWKPINGAAEYTFSIRDNEKRIFSPGTIKLTEISLRDDLLEEGTTYSWLITGETGSGKYFEYTGDFLIAE